MNKKIILPFIASALMSICSCGSSPTPDPGPTPEEKISYDKLVDNIVNLGFATGANSPAKTDENFGVGGCDLGFPVYAKEKNQIQFYFGDTFTSPNQTGMWRSNVIGIAGDSDDFDKGLNLDEFVVNDSGYLKTAINGKHLASGVNEVTKIPTGVIDIDGTLYMYYFSMFDWNANNDNMMNYGGAIKSKDFGKTWERVYDLTWVNPECKNSKTNIQALINEDVMMAPDKGSINIDDHYGFDATQIFPLDGKDGYIYFFIEGGYRNHGLKLARVVKENIEKFEEYEYFIGQYDAQGNAKYKKGKNGLAFIRNKISCEICNAPFGEMSAFYNAYLKKWCMMTCTGGSTIMYMADKIDGSWNKSCLLFPSSAQKVIPVGSIYAPMSCEAMQKENGKIMYMLCSTWMPYYNPSFIKIIFK